MRNGPQTGHIYGIGVGPGDPELMTLKAARLLAAAPVVAYFHKRGARGVARSIVQGLFDPDAVELALEYPLTTEVPFEDAAYKDAIAPFYDEAAARIAEHANARRDVAVVCEGDPFFYGSFMHLYRRLRDRFPIEVVPGITGMSACWTSAGVPITYGDDVLQVLPGTLPEGALAQRMRDADAVVVMKLGRNLGKVRRALTEAGLIERAIYVERGSMKGQIVQPLAERGDETAPYFAIVLVPGRGRCL